MRRRPHRLDGDAADEGFPVAQLAGFGGQRVYRTVSSDNREFIPDGGLPFFVYDDLEKEYNRKCRAFEPWIEEHHVLVPANVNGAALVRVTDDDAEVCIPCEACP